MALYIYGGGLLYIPYNLSPILKVKLAPPYCYSGRALYMPNMPVRLWGIFEINIGAAAGIVTLGRLNLTGSNAGGHKELCGAIVAFSS